MNAQTIKYRVQLGQLRSELYNKFPASIVSYETSVAEVLHIDDALAALADGLTVHVVAREPMLGDVIVRREVQPCR